MTEVKLDSILTFRKVLSDIIGLLVPFAQSSSGENIGFPDSIIDAGLCGQTGQDDPDDNRGVTGIQVTRGFYNNYFRIVTNVSSGFDKLNTLLYNLYDTFVKDYAHNDRRYDPLLTYTDGDVAYQEYQGFVAHGIYGNSTWNSVTLLHERGRTVLYEPTVYPGSVPSWAIDIGKHDTYSFTDYPGLENDLFKGVIESLSAFGASWTAGTGFTAPDLRGISPGVFTSAVAGSYIAHGNGQHGHVSSSVGLGLAAANSTHYHPGAGASHSSHTHSLTFRLGAGGTDEGESGYPLTRNGNKEKSWTVYTTGIGNHSHTITVADGTESHKHTISGTVTSGTANTGSTGTINRVSTYPVHFIVRVE